MMKGEDMMKKIRTAVVLAAILLLSVLIFASCGGNYLSKPIGLNLDVETQTLRWSAVKGAKYYTVQISGEEKDITTKSTSVSLENLQAGEYEIKIKANSDGEVFKDSDWAVYSFTREEESGLKYQLINNDTEFELVGGGKASGDVVMESTYRGKPVTSIAEKALYGNAKITSITIGDKVKTIGAKAFAKCSKLTSVTVPENVKSIGEQAFQSCKALTTVTLSDSITTINANTFDWCSALTKVTVGKSLVSIGEYAFANCEALTEITYSGADHTSFKACLPPSLKTIGSNAFSDCYALADISIGSGTETVGTTAFENCGSLERIDFGESLISIDTGAFSYCIKLNNLSIPNSTEKIADAAFSGCSSLENISIGSGMKSIGAYSFLDTKILNDAEKMLEIDGWLIQYKDMTADKVIINEGVRGIASYAFAGMPALIQADFKGVEYVGYAAFYQSAALYRISFDDALTDIGDYAFSRCPYLSNVSLGNSLNSIGSYAFYGCEDLSNITLPESLVSIGTKAFRNTKAYNNQSKRDKGVVYVGGWAVDYIPTGSQIATAIIENGTKGIANYTFNGQSLLLVSIGDSVEYIGRGAFYKCPMYMVNLPSSLKSIGDYAFYGCTYANFGGKYYDLVIPEGTEYVGRSSFYKCTNVLSVDIPGTVKSIGAFAFYGCSAIGMTIEFEEDTGKLDENGSPITETVPVTGYVKLGEGIESIGDRAFQGCQSLTQITIPNSVNSLGIRLFYKCAALKSVTLGSGISEICEYMFYKCEQLETVITSDSLESISNYAFRGCSALKNFDFKKVVSIGRYAFYGCSALQSITLPETIASIGDYAFRGCTSATAIVIPDSLSFIGKHVFYGLKTTSLYCESAEPKEDWNVQFNSSFRPIFWGVTLSENGEYVVSVIAGEDTVLNPKATNGVSDPIRAGYVFDGWATEPDSKTVAYTSQNVDEAPNGTVLYAIWTQQP